MNKNVKKNIGSLYKIDPKYNKDGYFLLLDHDKKSRKVLIQATNSNDPPNWQLTWIFHQFIVYEVE